MEERIQSVHGSLGYGRSQCHSPMNSGEIRVSTAEVKCECNSHRLHFVVKLKGEERSAWHERLLGRRLRCGECMGSTTLSNCRWLELKIRGNEWERQVLAGTILFYHGVFPRFLLTYLPAEVSHST